MTTEEFIIEMLPAAQAVCRGYGLRVDVCLAQAIEESGSGNSRIGLYNVFGRKYVDYGEYMEVGTQEEVDGVMIDTIAFFRVYKSLEAAVISYCILLSNEPYEAVKPLAGDLAAYVSAICEHYCTNSRYYTNILALIKEYNLTQYNV